MNKILSLFVVLLAVSACTFQTKHRGYIFPDNLESEIAGIKTTDQLESKIGSPQVKTTYGAPVWIYYGADENYHGPFPMTYDNKMALLVWTDISGKNVLKTKIMTDSDFASVNPDGDETEIPAAIELNALQELFNNVGRFTPGGLGQ